MKLTCVRDALFTTARECLEAGLAVHVKAVSLQMMRVSA